MQYTNLGFTEPVLVATKPGGQSGLSYAFGPAYDGATLKFVKVALYLRCLSGGADTMDVVIRIEQCDDNVSWPVSTAEPTAMATPVTRSTEGPSVAPAFEDISSLINKKYVRFVVWVKNREGITSLNTCQVSIRVDRRAC